MCGKFTQMASWREVHAYSQFLSASDGPIETVMPMRFANVLILDADGRRTVKPMRWGFARASAKNPSGRPDHIHARAETIDTKPTFRDAFLHRRGLLVVRSFNEGKELSPTKTEQHVLTPKDGKPLGIAVIWEGWTHPSEGELQTFVMVTVPPNALIGSITDRMPAIIPPEHWSTWLGEAPATPAELKALLTVFEGDFDMRRESKPARPKASDAQPDLF